MLPGYPASSAVKFHGNIAGLSFLNEVSSPRDPATGQASGKRQHSPVVVTKEWGAASPQLFQALVSNELLETVLFEFVKTTPNGKEKVAFTITLKDAVVSKIRQYIGPTPGKPDDLRELEDVAFVYRKIEIPDTLAKTAASDDWQV
jgi:type VI secretion system secreted protein Hcp